MVGNYNKYIIQATEGTLPADFEYWDLESDGWTVAHSAAFWGNIPHSFDRWGLRNQAGVSVLRHFLIRRPTLISTEFMPRWCAEKPLCKTEADWEVFKIEFPEIYSKHAMVESFDALSDAPSEVLENML
jgi:hypothetical protein